MHSPTRGRRGPLLEFALFMVTVTADGRGVRPGPYVSPCPKVSLSAQYLSEVAPGSGPGFHFVLENHTRQAIKLAMPVPSSAHWFAQSGRRWLWRASNGAGGSLVNADHSGGPMFAYQAPGSAPVPDYLTVPPAATHEWDESVRENPVLLYKPGCELCNHPDDRLYRVVFAYAYLPRAEESAAGVIKCGVRSNYVDVPPGHY